MKLQRYDKSFINDYQETPEGYLTVQVPITCPGVFPYQRQDGTIQMEAKLPEEIFSDRTIMSARGKPVTDEHPGEPVTVENYQTYAKGMSHTDSTVKHLKLYVSLTVTDKDLIKKINDGKREISIGFMSDVVAEKGTYNGQAYEYVQRNIEINHIAIVEKGRAGPEVAIRADSDAWQIDSKEGGSKLVKVKVNGVEYEVDAAVAAHLKSLESKDKDPEEEKEDKDNKKTPPTPPAKKEKEEKGDTMDAILGRLDSLESLLEAKNEEIAALKSKEMTEDAVDQRVQARVALISTASTFLGDSFDFVGKSERQIKEAVITAAHKDFKGDGKSDDYINAFFDSTVQHSRTQGFAATGAHTLITNDSSQRSDMDSLRAARLSLFE